MATSPPALNEARVQGTLNTLRMVALIELIWCCVTLPVSFDVVGNSLGIALGATVLAATSNAATNPVAAARAMVGQGCVTGLAIAIFVLCSLTIIIFAAIAFTLGIAFIAVAQLLNGNNNGTLTPSQQNTLNSYCSNSQSLSACKSVATTFNVLAAYFFMSWIFPLVHVGLAAGVLCAFNNLSSMVGFVIAPPAQSTVTVVMMPGGQAMPGQVVPNPAFGAPPGTVVYPPGTAVYPPGTVLAAPPGMYYPAGVQMGVPGKTDGVAVAAYPGAPPPVLTTSVATGPSPAYGDPTGPR